MQDAKTLRLRSEFGIGMCLVDYVSGCLVDYVMIMSVRNLYWLDTGWLCKSKRVRFFHAISPIGLAELFQVSFNGPGKGLGPDLEPWMGSFWPLCFHSSFGMAMEEIKLPNSISRQSYGCKKCIEGHSYGKSCSSQPIGECSFPWFHNPILHKCTKKPCSIQYAKMVNLDRNELRQCPNLCIIEISTVPSISWLQIFLCTFSLAK